MAGTGSAGNSGDGIPASQASLMLPSSVVMDPKTRDIYIADYANFAVKIIDGTTGRLMQNRV